MTRQGWNPGGAFGHYLRTQVVQDFRDRLNTPPTTRSGAREPAPRIVTR